VSETEQASWKSVPKHPSKAKRKDTVEKHTFPCEKAQMQRHIVAKQGIANQKPQ